MKTNSTINAVNLLGVKIARLNCAELIGAATAAAASRRRLRVLYVNVHCMNVSRYDERYRRILNAADIVYCDGTGVRLAAWLSGESLPARMTGADWIHLLCERATAMGLSLFLLAGAPGVAEEAALQLRRLHPGLRIAGTAPGYDITAETLDIINRTGADILLVGMGTPRQEEWIEDHAAQVDVPVLWAVGALFEFVSGRIPRGPRWMTDHGLEWLCRLVAEPRKLWRRYLIGNPQFFWWVVRSRWLPDSRAGSGRSGAGK